MTKIVKVNEAALQGLQDQADRAVQEVVRQVNAEMNGHPVDDVFHELERRVRSVNLEPTEAGLRTVAQEISDGTLTDND